MSYEACPYIFSPIKYATKRLAGRSDGMAEEVKRDATPIPG